MENEKPTLYLMVGLPGSGKTTRAKQIESEQSALRLTPDEWMLSIYGHDLDRSQRDALRVPVEALQWQVAKRVLGLHCNVILDWGLWTQEERTKYREEAEGLGASVKIVFLDDTVEGLWSRISQRPESLKGTLHITRDDIEQWATKFEAPSKEELM